MNQYEDAVLDSALNNLPLAPLPPNLMERVMTAVQPVSAASPAPIRFRLQFLDIALALFFSLILVLVWVFTLWWTGVVHFDWLPEAQAGFSLIELMSSTNPTLLLGGIFLILLEMCMLGLVALNLLGDRPTAL